MKQSNGGRWFLYLSIACFVASLFLDAFCQGANTCRSGWECLLIGWMGGVSWFANPMWFISLLLYRKPLLGLLFALAGLGLALLFLIPREIILDEAGHTSRVAQYLAGYWCWTGAMFTLTVSRFLLWWHRKQREKPHSMPNGS
ncbi:MAG: hypothetical protein ACFB10_18800 [Salibacteraceae bacterium]